MRKSSRGNPYHDRLGRFTTAEGCLSISERTDYSSRTEERLFEDYRQRLKDAFTHKEIDNLVEAAEAELSSGSYCDFYLEADRAKRRLYTPNFYELDAEEFLEVFREARESQPMNWRYVEKPFDTCFASGDGGTFALNGDEIVNLCVVKDGMTKGRHLVDEAVRRGGRRVEAYSGLSGFYMKCGFEPVEIRKADREDIITFEWRGYDKD